MLSRQQGKFELLNAIIIADKMLFECVEGSRKRRIAHNGQQTSASFATLHDEDAQSGKLAKGIRHAIECFLFCLEKKAEYFPLGSSSAGVDCGGISILPLPLCYNT